MLKPQVDTVVWALAGAPEGFTPNLCNLYIRPLGACLLGLECVSFFEICRRHIYIYS